MANVFETYTSRAIGNSLTAVGSHTVAASHTETYNDASNDTHIIKNAPLPAGSSLVPIGGDQKIVLTVGDSIKVSANTASSVDAVMSVLDQS